MKNLIKKIIFGIFLFPFILAIVIIVTPLLIISEIINIYKKVFNDG